MSNFSVVIGAGPAGLMAADKLASNGFKVLIVDRKPSFGRKFLMAGKSGLNLTKNENVDRSEISIRIDDIICALDVEEGNDE